MIDIKYYKAENSIEWIVKQFESLRVSGDSILIDKFIPRHDASIVFHF